MSNKLIKKKMLEFRNPPKRSRSAQRQYDLQHEKESLWGKKPITKPHTRSLGSALYKTGQVATYTVPIGGEERVYSSSRSNMMVSDAGYKQFLIKHHSPSVQQAREFKATQKYLKKKK